jgi:hypothetical protein
LGLCLGLLALDGPTAAPALVAAEGQAAGRVQAPAGLFVCRGPRPTPDREVNFPFIDGWLVRPGWDKVEPEEGRYDWRYIKREIATARRLGKKITLAILGGPQTPAWLYKAGARAFRYTYGSRYRTREEARIPVLWDEVYLTRWTALVRRLGKQFAGDPTVVLVHVTGATFNGLETQLPFAPVDQGQWRKLGYTPARAIAAWKRILSAYARAFPRTPLDIDVHPVLGSDEVATEVMAYGARKLGRRFGVFGGWLSGREAAQDRHHAGMHALARKYGRRSFAAFQLIGNETGQPERFGRGGARAAIEQGMSWGARYFEVWETDAMNPRMHDLLSAFAARIRKEGKRE